MRKIKYILMFPHSFKRKRLNDNNKEPKAQVEG